MTQMASTSMAQGDGDLGNHLLPQIDGNSLQELEKYFNTNTTSPKQYIDSDIQRISELLLFIKQEWSKCPRLYIILRTIGRLDLLESLVLLGLSDLWFPFSTRSFPDFLPLEVRRRFLESQWLVLTKGLDLEAHGSRHQSYEDEEQVPLTSVRSLGKGSFSSVDVVKSWVTGELYARKRMERKTMLPDAKEGMKTFVNELEIMKKARHRHIVELVGSYTDMYYIGIIFSPIADMDMAGYLTKLEEDGLEDNSKRGLIRSFFGCLLSGLGYLHSINIRHKDIKPENILIKAETVYFTDFNISYDWSEATGSKTEDTRPLMTKKYASPEMFKEEPRSSSSDIWSLGCVFLEMASVLNGRSRAELKNFLDQFGSRSTIFAKNIGAINTWVLKLRMISEDSINTNPLVWIQSMLKERPQERYSAQFLLEKVTASGSSVFCGPCCLPRGDNGLKPRVATYVASTHDRNINLPFEKLLSLQPSDTRPSSELVKPDNSVAVSKSALFAAVRAGDGVRVASLLKKGADIEWQDAVGQRALFKAIFYEKEAVARVLIESGADVNAVDQDNVSSLHEAISRGLRGTVELMIKKGADIHARRRDRVALEAAVDFKRAGLVRLLIDKGADVNSIGGHQFTPLHRCALSGNGDVKIAEILLENAANPNQGDEDGRKPLHFAVLYGFCDLVGLLLKYGAEINSIDNVYTTPLMVAAAKAQEAIIEILLEHHPDLTIIQSETEASAIHFAAKGGSPKVVQSMLYRGLSANSKDKWGRTPLFYTAEHNHPLCTTVLLNGGANRWLVDNKGRTALWLAARNGNDRIVDMLVDDDDDDAAADINMGDLDGVTPLHVAAAYGHFEAVKVLLQHGADLNVVDKDGHKPIDMAEHKGEERLVDLLLTEEQRARKE